MNEDSLPQKPHPAGFVPFKEAADMKALSRITLGFGLGLFALFGAVVLFRYWGKLSMASVIPFYFGLLCSIFTALPHELLHAVCFKKDVYLYTCLRRGMLFVVGTESMSKARFIFLSLLPNVVFGFVPYLIGVITADHLFWTSFGLACIVMGAGDYYNAFNALVQMPRGARTYMSGLHSFWYMP